MKIISEKSNETIKINLGDVIIMDNNTWHRASFIENRKFNKFKF